MKGPSPQKHATATLVSCSVFLPVGFGGLFAVNDLAWDVGFITAAEDLVQGLVIFMALSLLWMSGWIYDVFGGPGLLTDVALRPGVVGSGLMAGVLLWTMALPQFIELSYAVVGVSW